MRLDNIMTENERFFNIMDSIPAVAIPFSAVRTIMGVAQLAIASAPASVGLVGSKVVPDNETLQYAHKHGSQHVMHGALNAIRGLGEFALGFTGVGSLGLFIYQFATGRNFAPVVSYHEKSS